MDVSVSGTIDQKTYLKKIRGGFKPLSPTLDPPMESVVSHNAYVTICISDAYRHRGLSPTTVASISLIL